MNTSFSSNDQPADVQHALRGAEQLLNDATAAGGEKAAELRERALHQLKALRERLADAQAAAVEKGRAAARATDNYVHENPWRVVAGAVGIGVVVGLLLNRR